MPIDKRFMSLNLCVAAAMAFCVSDGVCAQGDIGQKAPVVRVSIDAADIRGDISTMLTGVNLIFCWQTKDLLADGRVATTLREARAGVLRFPGGEVTDYHHWEQPGYPGWKDAWETDPKHRHYTAPEEAAANTHHLDTDAYLALCREVGAEPMLGVNLESGVVYDRVDDGIAEALRWMRYCKEKGYKVRYWFIGNESYHTGTHYRMEAREYGEYIKRYAEAMRAVDPDIEIVANWSSTFSVGPWKALLEAADGQIDIADVHYYWNFGTASWDLWLSQAPMSTSNQWHKSGSFIEEIAKFHKMTRELGYDVKLSSLEWNVGPTGDADKVISPYQCAMIQSEQLGQYIAGGLDMATFWPLFSPPPKGNNNIGRHPTREYLDKTDRSPRPVHQAFTLWSNALGQQRVAGKSDNVRAPVVSALSRDGKTLRVWIQTKPLQPQTQEISLSVKGFEPYKFSAVALTSSDPATDDGAVSRQTITPKAGADAAFILTVQPYSLTMITLTRH
jgi:alpha-N-arabinofuranosidase